mmetsp:Transcript_40138/g.115853  ORF Transcript_40138/g.115853 Transcript_40138/m.115853 type:complete len:261 (-) Transcript_40138:49-831(-)
MGGPRGGVPGKVASLPLCFPQAACWRWCSAGRQSPSSRQPEGKVPPAGSLEAHIVLQRHCHGNAGVGTGLDEAEQRETPEASLAKLLALEQQLRGSGEEETAAAERQSSCRMEQLQQEHSAECSALDAEREALVRCQSELALAEGRCEELALRSERQEEERQLTEARISELQRSSEARLEEVSEEREGQRNEYEEHVDWLRQQLRSEKRGYEDQIAKLRAAQRRNEEQLLLLLHRQQGAKPEPPRRGSVAACGCGPPTYA